MASKIEWTDETWNPIRARNLETGRIGWHCERVSPGCEHCYSETMNGWRGTGLPFKPGHRKDVELFLDEDVLTKPLRWRKSRTVFVCSMTDLFADFVTDEWIGRIWQVMVKSHRDRGHVFQVLTKRPERIAKVLGPNGIGWYAKEGPVPHPEPGIWLGTSIEDRRRGEERCWYLAVAPAAVRFWSVEPLLADLGDLLGLCLHDNDEHGKRCVDWVILGGESGPGARPMHPGWARGVRDQCTAAGVAFFFKQWGAWAPGMIGGDWMLVDLYGDVDIPDHRGPDAGLGEVAMTRVGKKAAGRLLDGREWNEYPDG